MDDPIALFDAWFAEARTSEPNDPNAMALATADGQGRPSVRIVLLKGHGRDGFVFYTNREGRKAADLAVNPHAALAFHWKSLRRQVRVEGPITLATTRSRTPISPRAAAIRSWAPGRRTSRGRWTRARRSRRASPP